MITTNVNQLSYYYNERHDACRQGIIYLIGYGNIMLNKLKNKEKKEFIGQLSEWFCAV
jgi:hypothetical protein